MNKVKENKKISCLMNFLDVFVVISVFPSKTFQNTPKRPPKTFQTPGQTPVEKPGQQMSEF